MVDANIPDIALEPDKTVKKVQDKFRLDLSDEEAVHYMQSLIDESVHALFAAVVEQIHKFAQYWRKWNRIWPIKMFDSKETTLQQPVSKEDFRVTSKEENI